MSIQQIYPTYFDHLVVGTHNLVKGRLWLEKFMGVELNEVITCPEMATQSYRLRLGDTCFLELMAIDTSHPTSGGARWFGLDTIDVQERIAVRPRLIGWAARSVDVTTLCERTGGLLGNIHQINAMPVGRITSPDDGHPLEGGLIPQIIEWSSERHPSAHLPDQGCRFTWMEAAHPNPAKVDYLLAELGLKNQLVLTASPPYSGMTMCAYIKTPSGTKTLMS